MILLAQTVLPAETGGWEITLELYIDGLLPDEHTAVASWLALATSRAVGGLTPWR